MTQRFKILLIMTIALVVIGLGFVYNQAVNIVRKEVQEERREVASRNDGSLLEWSDYKVEGLHVVFSNFQYIDMRENIDFRAKSLRVTGRLNNVYNLEAQDGVVQFGRYDEMRFQNLSVSGFKNARRLINASFDNIRFDGLTWNDLSGSGAQVFTTQLQVDEYDDLHFKNIAFSDLTIYNPKNQMQFQSDPIRITDLRLLQSEKERIIGFLYEAFKVPSIKGHWFDQPFLQGKIMSHGKFEADTNLLQEGDFEADFALNLSKQQLAQNYGNLTPTDRFGRFLTRLPKEPIQGDLHISAIVTEGDRSQFRTEITGETLGSLTIDAEFAGYQTSVLRDLDDYLARPAGSRKTPASLIELKFLSGKFDYQDDQLANIYIENFANIDPAIASFMAQMTLPRYMPNDRELVRETSTALTDFLNGKDSLTLISEPSAPIPMADLITLFERQGPYKDALGVSVFGK